MNRRLFLCVQVLGPFVIGYCKLVRVVYRVPDTAFCENTVGKKRRVFVITTINRYSLYISI